MKSLLPISFLIFGLLVSSTVTAQKKSRDDKVRDDRAELKNDQSWYYDDLEKAIDVAASENKPLMAVLRCIP